jgi:micrococcal nuclease
VYGSSRRAVLGVALLVLTATLAGCVALGPATDGGATAGTADGIDGTPAEGPGTVAGGQVRAATVVEVTDGDTVTVRFGDGTTDTVRLLGVDTPETRASNSPGEFEGVPETEAGGACLRAAGATATTALTDRVLGERVDVATDPAADRRGGYGRLLAYLVHDGTNVNYRLVERGHARVYDSTFAFADRFYAAESAAMDAGRGVWRCRDPGAGTSTATPTP